MSKQVQANKHLTAVNAAINGIIKMSLKMLFHLSLVFVLVLFQLSLSSLVEIAPADAQTILINNPYKGYQYNYKGNLHCHSSNLDGSESPSEVGQWYLDNGYDFYTITDHDYITANPGISNILWLGNAEEDSWDGSTGHMNHINISSLINSGSDQARISNTLNQGGGTVINHPGDSVGGWGENSIAGLDGIMGVEIYNGRRGVSYTDLWDSMLSTGKMIWGLASDDSHQAGQRGNGYIVVNSSYLSPTKDEIMNQIKSGNFYASKGFDLSVTVSGQTIYAQTTNGNQIRWVKKSGTIIKTKNGQSDNYNVNGDEQYVRIEILDSHAEAKAWSQPIAIYKARPAGLLVKQVSSPKIYLLQGDTKCWITSPLAFSSHGFRFSDVINVTSSELSSHEDGDLIKARTGTLIKSANSAQVYIVDNQGNNYYKRWITSFQIFNELGLRLKDIHIVSDEEVQEFGLSSPIESTITHPNGCLVKSPSSPKIYWLEGGEKRWIVTPFAFDSHRFKMKSVVVVSESEIDAYQEGVALKARVGSLMKPSGDNKVYIVDHIGGVYYKRWITSSYIFSELELRWSNIVVISTQEAETYAEGEPIGGN